MPNAIDLAVTPYSHQDLIHVSDMSWTKKINHPSEILKKGDRVECIVMAIDKEKRRISLSMKHLEEDPWDTLAEKFPVGKEVQAKIARLLPTSKLTTDNIRSPAEAFKIGDEVPAAVIEVEPAARKLTLSVTDYFKNKEDAECKAYLSSHKPNLATLGDVMPKLEGE